MTLLGAPEKPLAGPAFALIMVNRTFSGSNIGGIAETQEMLDFFDGLSHSQRQGRCVALATHSPPRAFRRGRGRAVERPRAAMSGAASPHDAWSLRFFGRPRHEPLRVLLRLLHEKVAESVDVVAKALRQLVPYGAELFDDRVRRRRFHGASSSSSGVPAMGAVR